MAADADRLPDEQGGQEIQVMSPEQARQITWGSQYAEVLDILLNLDIPQHEKEFYSGELTKWLSYIWKNLGLGNIRREDIFNRYLRYYDIVILWLKVGRPDMALKRIFRWASEFQMTRSIEFGERLAQVTAKMEQRVTQETGRSEREGGRRFGIFPRRK